MSLEEHKPEIFRGLIKFKSNEQKIWGVLIFLSIVTIIEVALGIIKPDFLSAYSSLSIRILAVVVLVIAFVILLFFMFVNTISNKSEIISFPNISP